MKIHEKNKENPSFSFFSSCCTSYFASCNRENEQIPINKLSSSYKISSKTRKNSKISFPARFHGITTPFSLIFPMFSSHKTAKEPFRPNFYEKYPRNQAFLIEKYPYFIIAELKETNLTLKLDVSGQNLNLRQEISNTELNCHNFLEIFFNYLSFTFSEILIYEPNFSIYFHLTSAEESLSDLNSLRNFSNFLIKFEQSFLMKSLQSRNKQDFLKETDLKSQKFQNKTIRFSEEENLIKGDFRQKTCKAKVDLVLINFFHFLEPEFYAISKEILIQKIYTALSFSENLVVLLHKSFPLEELPEIFDISWSYFKGEPKNFSIEIELLSINYIFEGFFVFWGPISVLSYQKAIDFLFKVLFTSKNLENPQEIVEKQKKLLETKFSKHGLRIFEKVIFTYKTDENEAEEKMLYNLIRYLLNNSLVSFKDIKIFPFYKYLLTSSLNSFSNRRISSESKEKYLNSYEEKSSFLEKSHSGKSGGKYLDSNEDFDKKSWTKLKGNTPKHKNEGYFKEMKRDISFKTVNSRKMKESFRIKEHFVEKSRDFNIVFKRSIDSGQEMAFSSYSGEDWKNSDEDVINASFGERTGVYKLESLKKLYKSSLSFSFD